jgi:hypothetical protein
VAKVKKRKKIVGVDKGMSKVFAYVQVSAVDIVDSQS